nr:hypothetical protein [Tanacetum cinerariifolium]
KASIAQPSALPPVADELASPLRDVCQGEACPTVSSLDTEQDMANIAKISTLPHESTSRVPSLAAYEGSLQLRIQELTDLCTSLQRQKSDLVFNFKAQELEITMLKARVKLLEDREGGVAERFGDDAPIKRRSLDKEEEVAEKGSNDIEEMINVLTSMDAATVLSSGVAEVPTGSGSIPTAVPPTAGVPTGSDVVPTAGPIFATATVVTPYIRRKGKEKMIESETPKKKKIQESNETVVKYLQEYHQFATELPIERRIELISDLVSSKEEAERFKRKGIRFEQESVKKLKTSEEVKATKEVPEEKLKELMQLVPVEEVYVEALQVKHLIIDWKVHTKGQRSYWKVTRLVVEWKLYDTSGVHHVTSKDKEIFMLVEKDYPLRNGLAIVMIYYKLHVENYSQMANDLILKIYKIANYPSQKDD